MDGNLVLRKTNRGQDEIKSRAHNLDSKIRTVLIFVNGKSSINDIHTTLSKMHSYTGKQYLEASLQTLIDQGFISAESERIIQISSEYGTNEWTEEQALEIKNGLIDAAHSTLGKNSEKVVIKLGNAPNTKEGIIAAVDACEKLVRLFIDETKANELAFQCHVVISDIS